MWEEERRKNLWNHKQKMQIDKLAEKNVSTVIIEKYMERYKAIIQELEDMPKERNAFFISESFVQVIQSFKE